MRNTCSIEGCSEYVVGRGWCRKHYGRWYKKGSVEEGRRNARGGCSVEGCIRSHAAKGLCAVHYRIPRQKAARLAKRQGRICALCGEAIPVERNAKAKFCSYECKTKAHNTYSERRHLWQFEYFLRTKFGLSLADYEALVEKQGGCCAICEGDVPHGRGRWHVDHCHKSNRVRGLLCHDCNVGLGHFEDDPWILRKAATYLER